jgi:ABC-type glutathione transport system ATPase component
VAVMYAGRIVEVGSREAIYEHPLHPYTRLLLSAIPTGDRVEDAAPSRSRRAKLKEELRALGVEAPLREVEPGHLVALPASSASAAGLDRVSAVS